VELFLQLSAAIKRTGRQLIFGMASNETFVCSDRAFDVAFFFGSLSDLKQLRSVPTYFFYRGFSPGLKITEALPGSGKKNTTTATTKKARITNCIRVGQRS